jgi:hypothetical protein
VYLLILTVTGIKIKCIDGDQRSVLKLKGLIYFGGFHFTCRIISEDDVMWFHDGMVTGSDTVLDGKLDEMSYEQLHTCRGKKLEIAVYAKM